MARLNTRPSDLPSVSRSYRSATSPAQQDQENIDPDRATGREKLPPRSVMQQPTQASPRLVASTHEGRDASPGHKRRRVANSATIEPADPADEDEDEKKFTKYFDPYQDAGERRGIKKRTRELHRGFHERRDELLQGQGDELTWTVQEADQLYNEVKQTDNATLDSRLLVDVSDLAYKKSAALVLDDNSAGIDVDDFLSKVISYMRNHAPDRTNGGATQPSSTHSRSHNADEADGDDEIIDTRPLDWESLGREACHPYNSRPAVRTFLLGPLSREKKQRANTQRRARNARDANVREAKPQALTNEDLTQNDQNSLTSQCTAIQKLLKAHCKEAIKAIKATGITDAEMLTSKGQTVMEEHLVSYAAGKVGVPLLRYIVNPNSFGQTVENLFYVSFLIKEGSAGVVDDDTGLPLLFPAKPRPVEVQRAQKISKHQAVLSIDYDSWKRLVEAYDIRQPMIPHRQEEQTQLGARGWYG